MLRKEGRETPAMFGVRDVNLEVVILPLGDVRVEAFLSMSTLWAMLYFHRHKGY
jgi:hypothetical protein